MAIKLMLISSAKNAVRSAIVVFASALSLFVLRIFINFVFGEKDPFQWELAIKLSFYCGLAWFLVFLLRNIVAAMRLRPFLNILDETNPEPDIQNPGLSGFVAMEYFWLIMNRTYLIFIAPEGLYGWRVMGPVTNVNPNYYEPYQNLIEDEEFMRNYEVIHDRSRLAGGFFIERPAIVSVEVDDRQKWGMGGIPHSGRIYLHLVSGKTREFILLGNVYSDNIRDKIVSVPDTGVLSVV